MEEPTAALRVDDRTLVRALSFLTIFPPVVAVAPAGDESPELSGAWRIMIVLGLLVVVVMFFAVGSRGWNRREVSWVGCMIGGGVLLTVVSRLLADWAGDGWGVLGWCLGVVTSFVYFFVLWEFEDRVLADRLAGDPHAPRC